MGPGHCLQKQFHFGLLRPEAGLGFLLGAKNLPPGPISLIFRNNFSAATWPANQNPFGLLRPEGAVFGIAFVLEVHSKFNSMLRDKFRHISQAPLIRPTGCLQH